MSQTQLNQLKQLADQLSADEKRLLTEHIAEQLQKAENSIPHSYTKKPQDLYGIWQGCFPDELDLDLALNEIRHEWEEEWLHIASPRFEDDEKTKTQIGIPNSINTEVSSILQDMASGKKFDEDSRSNSVSSIGVTDISEWVEKHPKRKEHNSLREANSANAYEQRRA
ncbi:MAG: hypothetical protein WBV94_18150 [Blastocatellia bacterium]